MRKLLIALTLILSSLSIHAQTNTETMPLTGAYDITIPSEWSLQSKSITGYFWETDDSIFRIRTYAPYFLIDWELNNLDLAGFFEWLVTDALEGRSFDKTQLTETKFGSATGYQYSFETVEEGKTFSYQVFGYQREDGTIIIGYAKPQISDSITDEETMALKDAVASVIRRDKYVFYDGTSFNIEDTKWTILDEITLGLASTNITNGSIELRIVYMPRYGAMAGFEDIYDFFAWNWNRAETDLPRFDRSQVVDTRISGYDAIYYPVDSPFINNREMYRRGQYLFKLAANESYVFIDLFTSDPNTEDIDDIYSIVDTFKVGNRIICPLFANEGISIREEPSTSSEKVRQTFDETLIAQFDTIGTDGYRWFNIGEGWIRSDVIFFELNTCEGLPRR